MSRLAALALCLAAAASPLVALAHDSAHAGRLSTIGPAPGFALTAQDGRRVALADLRGKAVAVAFIYTSCGDVCPLLTEKMAQVQGELGQDFGRGVAFVSITVDPARDTPEALRQYAAGHGADVAGWSFLTGSEAAVRAVARGYGVVVAKGAGGAPDHTLLTTLVDKRGLMRVQYLGARFDPEEFRRDLLSLVSEP